MSFKSSWTGKWISAKRVVNHPNYGNHDNDIAVLEVSSLLITPIQTCQSNYQIAVLEVATYWSSQFKHESNQWSFLKQHKYLTSSQTTTAAVWRNHLHRQHQACMPSNKVNIPKKKVHKNSYLVAVASIPRLRVVIFHSQRVQGLQWHGLHNLWVRVQA